MTWLERIDRQRRIVFPTTQDQGILAVMEVPRDNARVHEDLFTRRISITESIPELLCSDGVTSSVWAVEHLDLPSNMLQHVHGPRTIELSSSGKPSHCHVDVSIASSLEFCATSLTVKIQISLLNA